jgi:DNA-binding transcriptional MerR regulator
MHTPGTSQASWRIGEIAKLLGVTERTLRHYERVGLLRPPQRTAHSYRMYDNNDVQRARHVMGLRGLGLSLEEIRSLLDDHKTDQTRRQRLLGLLDEKLHEIDVTLAVLQGKRDDMAARYLALVKAPKDSGGDCTCAALVACNCTTACACGEPRKRPAATMGRRLLKASSKAVTR